MYHLGNRIRERFQDLFSDEYHPDVYQIRATQGLTVLEYLVANGSERVIEEIKEHSYHITSLSDFQYLDHTGRDQGNNVRKRSQSLVALVNDKEKIQEVREKAAANWDNLFKSYMNSKKEIAKEYQVDWDTTDSEAELLKPPEKLNDGPDQTKTIVISQISTNTG